MAVTTETPAGFSLPALMQSANARLLLMMGGAAAIVALMAGVWFWGQKPEYRVLFANYSDRDGGAIVAALQQMNVPYEFAGGGSVLRIPAPFECILTFPPAGAGKPRVFTIEAEVSVPRWAAAGNHGVDLVRLGVGGGKNLGDGFANHLGVTHVVVDGDFGTDDAGFDKRDGGAGRGVDCEDHSRPRSCQPGP